LARINELHLVDARGVTTLPRRQAEQARRLIAAIAERLG
jgi:hypothetical protein